MDQIAAEQRNTSVNRKKIEDSKKKRNVTAEKQRKDLQEKWEKKD